MATEGQGRGMWLVGNSALCPFADGGTTEERRTNDGGTASFHRSEVTIANVTFAESKQYRADSVWLFLFIKNLLRIRDSDIVMRIFAFIVNCNLYIYI